MKAGSNMRSRGYSRIIKTFTAAAAIILTLSVLYCASGCKNGENRLEGGNGVQLSELIAEEKPFTVELTEICVCPAQGDYKIAQGAATDGKYAYFVMRQSENGDCIVCKYELSTGKLVKTSEPVYLFHGNDMTYDSKRGLLYVAHAQSEGKILTSVDPATLSVIEQTIEIEKGSGAITYSAERDQIAISQGGKKIHFLDGELRLLKSIDRVDDTGYTAQGMGSDESYIYFPMSGLDSNFIEVYDWEGNYVTHFLLDAPWESETMFWWDGIYFICFNDSRAAHLYRMEFIQK